MAEWLGQALGSFPGWLVILILLIIIVVAIEFQLLQTGESLIDIWRRKYGKK